MINFLRKLWKGQKYLIIIIAGLVIFVLWANKIAGNVQNIFGIPADQDSTGWVKLEFDKTLYQFYYIGKVRNMKADEYEIVKSNGKVLGEIKYDDAIYFCVSRYGIPLKDGTELKMAWLDRYKVIP